MVLKVRFGGGKLPNSTGLEMFWEKMEIDTPNFPKKSVHKYYERKHFDSDFG